MSTEVLERPSTKSPSPVKREGEGAKAFPTTITLNRKELAKALATILPANEKGNTIPILSGVLFVCGTGCLTITATNLDQYLTASIVADADRPSRFVLLEPQGLAALLKLLDQDEVTLTFGLPNGSTETNNPVVLKSGPTEAEFHTLHWEDFPTFSLPPRAATELHFGGAELIRAIDRVGYAVSTEETRYYLNGIYLTGRPNYAETGFEPWMVATNGHQLAMARVEDDLGLVEPGETPAALSENPYGVIIPAPAVAILKALAARGAVDIQIWDTAIAVMHDDFSFYSKLIDGTYPDYQRVIPSANDQHAILSPAMIIPAIKRASTLCRAKTVSLKITIDGEAIELQMRDIEGGKVTETVKLPEAATRRFEHGVNGKYLAEVLGSFAGPVTYSYSDPGSPMVLYSADAASQATAAHLAVLMPMRV